MVWGFLHRVWAQRLASVLVGGWVVLVVGRVLMEALLGYVQKCVSELHRRLREYGPVPSVQQLDGFTSVL